MFDMTTAFSRSERLFGKEAMDKLARSRVAVFGLGGVGGYASEALARSGVGALDLIDGDVFDFTNLNRQIFATCQTIGKYKTEAARERIADINPQCVVTAHRLFYLPETASAVDFAPFDYVIDAIDTVTGKLAIIERATALRIPVISAMGTGNKVDPTRLEVADIFETSVCPLARVMRRELKRRGIERLKVVYSREEPVVPVAEEDAEGVWRSVPGSTAFVPPAAGLILAGEVVKDLIGYGKSTDRGED